MFQVSPPRANPGSEGEVEVHLQGPTFEERQGEPNKVFPATSIPLWSQDLVTNSRCQYGDRHRDEKSRVRAPAPPPCYTVDVITLTATAKGGRCWC